MSIQSAMINNRAVMPTSFSKPQAQQVQMPQQGGGYQHGNPSIQQTPQQSYQNMMNRAQQGYQATNPIGHGSMGQTAQAPIGQVGAAQGQLAGQVGQAASPDLSAYAQQGGQAGQLAGRPIGMEWRQNAGVTGNYAPPQGLIGGAGFNAPQGNTNGLAGGSGLGGLAGQAPTNLPSPMIPSGPQGGRGGGFGGGKGQTQRPGFGGDGQFADYQRLFGGR